MKVYFIGAGPGAPDLLTMRGRTLIARCPICLYAGSLVPKEVVAMAGSEADVPADSIRVVNTAGMALADIMAEFERARAQDLDVARVHSGDPAVFSAVGEQIAALKARNIAYEIVPGVPSFAASAAALGRELTMPGVAQSVVLTRFGRRGSKMPPADMLERHAKSGATLAIHLSVRDIDAIADVLAPFYGADCPAAVVYRASCQEEKIIEGTLAEIARRTELARITRSAIVLVGRALGDLEAASAAHVYAQEAKKEKTRDS